MRGTYTLTENIKKMLESKGLVFTCDRCKQPITLGEQVVAKRTSGKVKRLRHKSCYERLFI